MAFQGPLNLLVPENNPRGRWGRAIPASPFLSSGSQEGCGGGQEPGSRVEMENEVVGQDRWACIWKPLWHGFKAQSKGSKATLGEVVPGPQARLPLPRRRPPLGSPVLSIPLSFF